MSDIEISDIAGITGGVVLGIIIISVSLHFIRSKRRRTLSRPAPQPQRQPQTNMRPVVISDAQPPQPQWHRPQNIRPYQPQNPQPYQPHNVRPHQQQNPYQTPIPETHYPTYANTDQQLSQNTSYPDLATPPTTYQPRFNVHHHVSHTYTLHTFPQTHEQPTQPQPHFSSEDLLSFDATGDDKESPCPICLGPLEEEPISTGQCLHLMHTSCLKNWLAKDTKSACPVCRLPFSDDLNTPHRPTPTAPPPPPTVHNSAGPT